MKKILIIDDTANFRVPVAAALRREGYEVITAADGQEGLELAQKDRPDLIFLDVSMPVMDGIACLRALRASEPTRTTPIIMLTARAEAEIVVEATKLGVVDYLLKASFSFGEVLTKVRKLIGKGPRQAEVPGNPADGNS